MADAGFPDTHMLFGAGGRVTTPGSQTRLDEEASCTMVCKCKGSAVVPYCSCLVTAAELPID